MSFFVAKLEPSENNYYKSIHSSSHNLVLKKIRKFIVDQSLLLPLSYFYASSSLFSHCASHLIPTLLLSANISNVCAPNLYVRVIISYESKDLNTLR